MLIKQILIVKETKEGESRVALTPEAIASFSSRQYRILVETGAGLKAGFTDLDYMKASAEIFVLSEAGYPKDTLILRVKRAKKTREYLENELFHENTFMMGFLDPFVEDNNVENWKKSGITTFSLDLFKNLSSDDPKNVLAAMSRMAGRLAFQDGLARYKGEKPVRLTVIGTGPAAFSAAFEARTGLPVQVIGRRDLYREDFEKAGAVYHVIPESENRVNFIREYLREETIVMTGVRIPGMKSPVLMDEESLKVLPKGQSSSICRQVGVGMLSGVRVTRLSIQMVFLLFMSLVIQMRNPELQVKLMLNVSHICSPKCFLLKGNYSWIIRY